MQIEVLKSKIHRVTVTKSNLNYIGSITIDESLIEAANMVVGEITLNGPAARKVQKGDKIIIISYARMSLKEAKTYNPTLIFPNENNFIEQ